MGEKRDEEMKRGCGELRQDKQSAGWAVTVLQADRVPGLGVLSNRDAWSWQSQHGAREGTEENESKGLKTYLRKKEKKRRGLLQTGRQGARWNKY